MIDRACDLADEGADIVLGDHVRARPHLGEDQGPVGLGGDDLAADVEGGHRAAHVVVLGIAEVVGEDSRLGAPGAIGELDLAAALGPADAEIEAEAGPAVQSQGEVLGREVGGLELQIGHRLAGARLGKQRRLRRPDRELARGGRQPFQRHARLLRLAR